MREIATDIGHVLLKCPLPPAPSAAPSNVRVTGATSTTITVQWGTVPCIHRNGEITGYSVRYNRGGSAQTMAVTEREATIWGLMSSTTYSIEVAAVTRPGTGEYSQPKTQLTQGQWYIIVWECTSHPSPPLSVLS